MNDDFVKVVLLKFFFVLRMCPLTVGMDFGKCLRTVAKSSPGNVGKKPLSIAFVHV